MCVEDLLWTQKLLKELKLDAKAGKLHIDNQSTIKVCTDAGNFDGVRRYAKKSRKIAELVDKKKENIADMFTKALGPQRFEKLRDGLGVKDIEGMKECQENEDVEDRSHDEKGAEWRPSVKSAMRRKSKAAVMWRKTSAEDRIAYDTEVDGMQSPGRVRLRAAVIGRLGADRGDDTEA
ncbi:hypothetical protein PHMEG_00027542 [Phytophthora megakarya]|uniref:Uncharacterized protein n=1 Tax=Phytophthora megakarya TaxID=4795 RepID=A0A225V754_9STRA|nr:hypothetical protein PHMEG_00027542 [Phytophthora megakarya]